MGFLSSILFVALIGVSAGWATTALLPKGLDDLYVYLKREFPVPKELLVDWKTWHGYHCSTPNDQPCAPIGAREAEPGEVDLMCPAQFLPDIRNTIQRFLARNPLFKPIEPWSLVSFDCCAKEEHDKLGIAVAQSDQFVVTIEPYKPQYGQSRPNIAISAKRHCMAPNALPLVGGVKYIPRHVNAWPDHFHVWLDVDISPRVPDILEDEVAFPSSLQPAERADTKYSVFTRYTSWFVVTNVWKFSQNHKDIVAKWAVSPFGTKYLPLNDAITE